MKKITFITTNKYKVAEINLILNNYGIIVEQLDLEYEEGKEDDMGEVCVKAAKLLADKLDREVIVEDTGCFFSAYNNFPGPHPKFIFKGIGYDGIFRLLDGKNREAYFKTVIGYCCPGEKPVLFSDVMNGMIIEKVVGTDKDVMPYDRIFAPGGSKKVLAEMTLGEKTAISQRGKVAKKLAEYLNNK